MAKAKKADTPIVSDDVVTPEVLPEPAPAAEQPSSSPLARLSPYEKKVIELKPLLDLSISGHADKDGYKKVEEGLKQVRKTRLEAEKVGEDLGRPVKDLYDQIRSKTKDVVDPLKEIENGLKEKVETYKDQVEAEKKRIEEEHEAKIARRFDQIVSLGAKFNGFSSYTLGGISISAVEARSLSDADFIEITSKMEEERTRIVEAEEAERKQREQEAEEERKRKEQEEKEQEAERQRQKEESDRLDAENKKLREEQEAFKKQQEEFADQQRKAKEKEEAEAAEKKLKEEEAEKSRLKALEEAENAKKEALTMLRSAKLVSLGCETDMFGDYYFGDMLVCSREDLVDSIEDGWAIFVSELPDKIAAYQEQQKADQLAEENRLKALKEQEEKEEKDRQKAAKEFEAERTTLVEFIESSLKSFQTLKFKSQLGKHCASIYKDTLESTLEEFKSI